MAFYIPLGWWLVPLAVTLIAFGLGKYACRDNQPGYGYGAAANGVLELLVFGAALIVSLIAWLVWAVLS